MTYKGFSILGWLIGSGTSTGGRSKFAFILSLAAAVAATLLSSASPARPAEVTYSTDQVNVIVIQGEITSDDDDKFARIAPDPQKRTGVLLSSNGGNVVAALAIGEMIHRNGYSTIVPDGQVCASACGLIWLAGASRMVSETARIGFHAAYVGNGDAKAESGVGNAMVGAYLARIGLSYKAVAFLTSAPPSDMQWLHPDEARAIGIDFMTVPAEPSSEQWSSSRSHLERSEPPAATPTPAASSRQDRARDLVLSWYALWSNMGTDTSSLSQYYGDTVQYYGGAAPKAKVMLEKQKFAVRWPIRNYKVRADPLSVSCASTCWVTGVVDWIVSSPERGERSIGSASFGLEMPASGPFLVLSENGSVITRHKEPLSSVDVAAAGPVTPMAPQAMSPSAGYAEGRQARIDFELWVAGLTDPAYKDGVLFWATNRSNNPPPSCRTAAIDELWFAGCSAGQARLTPLDARRRTEKDFRVGWNSL